MKTGKDEEEDSIQAKIKKMKFYTKEDKDDYIQKLVEDLHSYWVEEKNK
jgi:hypothetical protein